MANPTPAKSWKRDRGEEVELPSGNVALVKRPGMEKLFSAGVLPDELTKIALESIDKANSGGKPQDHKSKGPDDIDPEMMKKFMEGENAVQDIFDSFDRITEMCVIEPPVKWHMRKVLIDGLHATDDKGKPRYEEIPLSDRDEDTLYTDDIDMEDKTFIFNFVVGGTRDIERFREEYGDAVATVQPREDVAVSAESTAVDRE